MPEHTIVIDLTRDPDALLAAVKRNTRNKIRHAERDGTLANAWFGADDAVFQVFLQSVDEHARQKTLPTSNKAELRALRQNGVLTISNAVAPSGEVLVWHSYICVGHRARLLHSASLFPSSQSSADRQAVGRANRFLHFKDMLAFKSASSRVYDFGGWYAGTEDFQRLRINSLKEEFGGQVALYFNCELGLTLLGKCGLMLNHPRNSDVSTPHRVSARPPRFWLIRTTSDSARV